MSANANSPVEQKEHMSKNGGKSQIKMITLGKKDIYVYRLWVKKQTTTTKQKTRKNFEVMEHTRDIGGQKGTNDWFHFI